MATRSAFHVALSGGPTMTGLRVGRYTLTAAEVARFWSHVIVRGPRECWLWRARFGGEYPTFRIYRSGRVIHLLAHVVALATKRVPAARRAGPLSTHSCDVKSCNNPAHLHHGTNSSNLREAWARGRRAA